jgi:hypothetical protein
MEPAPLLDFRAWGGRFSRARGQDRELYREPFSLSLIFSENRYPFFGIMLQTAG